MIIYDPTTALPDTFNANYASSIDLAPSLLHLLGIPNEKMPLWVNRYLSRMLKIRKSRALHHTKQALTSLIMKKYTAKTIQTATFSRSTYQADKLSPFKRWK
jgi:arylsulfatase A-like enzyme